MDIHLEDVIISIINIIILFILMRIILWKTVIRYLSERSERISKQFDDAEGKERQADALLSLYDEKVDKLKERDREMLLAGKERASREAALILSKAQEDAAMMVRDAESRIAMEKNQALAEAHEEVTRLATDMASRILRREVSMPDNEGVVEEFFK